MSETLPTQPQPDNETRASVPDDLVKPITTDAKTSKCPACKIGNLFVIASDPDSTHEQGNAEASQHAHFEPSGGSQIVHCFNCGIQSSQPLEPKDGR